MIADQRVFVDTNVLIYARDPSAGVKHAAARLWLERLATVDQLLLNLQVLNELTRWILRKENAAVPVARDAVDMLRAFGEKPLAPEDVELAWDVRNHLGYQWFDCLLVACSHFLSEDMGHETRYGQLIIINPFRVDPDAFFKAN
ncbi:MAG: PIN domain-containing protein [Bosea sp. (in: a-proteobacteria)]